MNKMILTLLSCLFFSSVVLAEDRAVLISLKENGDTLKYVNVNAIRNVVAQAVTTGIVNTLLTYQPEKMAKNKFLACVSATQQASQAQFTDFVNQLQRVPLRFNPRYQVSTQETCSGNDASVCMANPLACFNPSFISSGAFSDYVAKTQVQQGFDEITVGKLLMDMRLNQGLDVPISGEIGLQYMSKNCSAITAYGTAADGMATIQCTIAGNAAVVGKTVTWTRYIDPNSLSFVWACTTDVDNKFAPRQCKN